MCYNNIYRLRFWLYRKKKEEISVISGRQLCDTNQENLPEVGELEMKPQSLSGRSRLQGKSR